MQQPFERAFTPSRRIDMTIIFPSSLDAELACPRCGRQEGSKVDTSRIEWYCFPNIAESAHVLLKLTPMYIARMKTVGYAIAEHQLR